jgi:hypothetical protein
VVTSFLLPMVFLIGITFHMAFVHVFGGYQARREQEIARRGEFGQGRIVGIQRPFLLDSTTRLYFEFAPAGSAATVRCCHVLRTDVMELASSLPAPGAVVAVRYLPEDPQEAVIGKLVSQFDARP